MKVLELKAERRKATGKGSARALRKQGKVPAILYGKGMEAVPLTVSAKDFIDLEHHGGSPVLNLSLDGETYTVVVKEISRDILKDSLLHVDFQRVKLDEKITTMVPLSVVGEAVCPGIKQGGVLQHGVSEIEVEALPGDLPEHIEIDLSAMEIGDAFKVKDITPPSGVKILSEPEEVVVTILPPTTYEEELVVEEEEEVEEVAEAAVEEAAEVPSEEEAPSEGSETTS